MADSSSLIAILATLGGLGGISGICGIIITLYHNQEQRKTDRLKRLRESIDIGLKNLSNENLEARIAGVYALEQAAEEIARIRPSLQYQIYISILDRFIEEYEGSTLEKKIRSEKERIYRQHRDKAENDNFSFFPLFDVLSAFVRRRSNNYDSSVSDFPADISAALTVISRRSEPSVEYQREHYGQVDLHGSNLARADLSWMTLAGANLRGANLQAADLYGANLESANLESANLERAKLHGANLKRVDLSSTSLNDAFLDEAHTLKVRCSWRQILRTLASVVRI